MHTERADISITGVSKWGQAMDQRDDNLVDVEIKRFDVLSPQGRVLIGELNAELSAIYPEPGANHFRLDPDEVAEGRGAFVVVSLGGVPIGCGAVRKIDSRTGELKRMYIAKEHRSRGIGRELVAALESHARELGISRLVLETGVRQHAAIALYNWCGFVKVEPFGEYVTSPLSICMEKQL